MNIKRNALAIAVTAACAGNAHAGALGADVEIFVGGATAPTNFLRETAVQNYCADPAVAGNFIDVYVDTVNTAPAPGVLMTQDDHWVVHCKASSAFSAALAGKTMAIYKYDGGSATGVTPISEGLENDHLDATASGPCALSSAGNTAANGYSWDLYECGSGDVKSQISDGGISDVEPNKFVGELAVLSAKAGQPGSAPVDYVDRGNLPAKAGPGLNFGVVVTESFRNELQDDQIGLAAAGPYGEYKLDASCDDSPDDRERADCMPTIPKPLVRAAFSGDLKDWEDFPVFGKTIDTGAFPKKVNVCRRMQGSGTHAQHMIHYMRTNCTTDSIPMTGGRNIGPLSSFFENSGSSDLSKCLHALENGTGYDDGADTFPAVPVGQTGFAMGYQSLEKNPTFARDFRFVKVDGVTPTLQNAHAGLDQSQMYYLSFQGRTAAPAFTGITPPANVVDATDTYVTGGVRTVAVDATEEAAIAEFFAKWNSLLTTGDIAVTNTQFEVLSGTADEWQGGFLLPTSSPDASFTLAKPATGFARQDNSGDANSCQPLRNYVP